MRITCIVDNCAGRGSTLWGEHGLAFMIEAEAGSVLWDTGQSGTVLEHNLRELSLGTDRLAGVALSHAHLDHTGGLSKLLSMCPGVSIYAHPEIFRERYSRRKGDLRAIGIAGQKRELEARTLFHLSDAPEEILPGVWTTGGIHPRPHSQGTSPHLAMRGNGEIVPDAHLDDMSLVLRVQGGIVLLCGCCHAGLLNTLAAVRAHHKEALVAIVGGTHLVEAKRAELDALIRTMRGEGFPRLHLNHCTGERATLALSRAFGERVSPCPAGTVLDY